MAKETRVGIWTDEFDLGFGLKGPSVLKMSAGGSRDGSVGEINLFPVVPRQTGGMVGGVDGRGKDSPDSKFDWKHWVAVGWGWCGEFKGFGTDVSILDYLKPSEGFVREAQDNYNNQYNINITNYEQGKMVCVEREGQSHLMFGGTDYRYLRESEMMTLKTVKIVTSVWVTWF